MKVEAQGCDSSSEFTVRKMKLIAECTACTVLQSRIQRAFLIFVLPT